MILVLVLACTELPLPPDAARPGDPPTVTPTTGTTTTDACAGGPLEPLATFPPPTPAFPANSSALGPQLTVTGTAAPGAVLTASWPAADGTTVEWYQGGALTEDCEIVGGDGCLWVDGGVVATTVAAGGVATATIAVDPALAAGDLVAIQAVVDGALVSPVWAAAYVDGVSVADHPLVTGATPVRLLPGTYLGLPLGGWGPGGFVVRADAGETVTLRGTWPPIPDPSDQDVSLFAWAQEGHAFTQVSYEIQYQEIRIEAETSQWIVVGAETGMYDPVESAWDLVIDIAPPATARTWYADGDADGYGDAPLTAVTRPQHASDVGGDCDPLRADVHPAADEVCGDGLDADCDGRDDCATVLDGPGPAARAVHASAAVYLSDASAPGDLTGDGVGDLLVVGTGGTHLLAGPFDGDVELEAARVATFDEHLVVGLGDLTGDGLPEVAVAREPHPGDATIDVLSAPFVGALGGDCAVTLLSGGSEYGGFVPQRAGDTDGDGRSELLVAGVFSEAGPQVLGAALFRDVTASRAAEDADVIVTLTEPAIGGPIPWIEGATPDLDGDGLADLALWEYHMEGTLTTLLAPLPPRTELPAPVRTVAAPAWPGLTTADLDGDGTDDLTLPTGLVDHAATMEIVTGAGAATIATLVADDVYHSGWPWPEVAAVGDVDGDGFADLALGGNNQYDALWIPGPLAGAVDVDDVAISWPGIWRLRPSGDALGAPGLLAIGTAMEGEAPTAEPVWLLGGAP